MSTQHVMRRALEILGTGMIPCKKPPLRCLLCLSIPGIPTPFHHCPRTLTNKFWKKSRNTAPVQDDFALLFPAHLLSAGLSFSHAGRNTSSPPSFLSTGYDVVSALRKQSPRPTWPTLHALCWTDNARHAERPGFTSSGATHIHESQQPQALKSLIVGADVRSFPTNPKGNTGVFVVAASTQSRGCAWAAWGPQGFASGTTTPSAGRSAHFPLQAGFWGSFIKAACLRSEN